MNKAKLTVVIIVINIITCINVYGMNATNGIPQDVMKVIQFSNSNKEELLKVLDYFKDNKEKYEAACFLIRNMVDKYYYDGYNIQDFYYKTSLFIKNTPDINNKICQKFYDTILGSYGNILDGSIKKYDIDNIKADSLITDINLAFESWKSSWCHDISFNLFCNFVLPYRIGEEPLSNWRQKYISQYGKYPCNLQRMQDNRYHKFGIYADLNENIPLSLYIPKNSIVDFPLDMLPYIFMGNCESIAYFTIAQLRALGIPATLDYVPQWGNRSMGHSWGVMFLNDSTTIPFGRGEPLGIHFNARPERRLPKVLRKTYAINKELTEIASEKQEYVPEILKKYNIADVTSTYTSTSDVEIVLYDNPAVRSRRWVFLTVFDNEDWAPVWFGVIREGKAYFSKMGRGIVYLPVIYDKSGQYISAGDPFILSDEGAVKPIAPNMRQHQPAVLKRKYSYTPRVDTAHKQIIGGSFALSNERNFSDSLFVGTIQDYGINAYCSLPVNDEREYKYVKYHSSPENMSQTAELLFYDKEGKPINIVNTYSLKNDTKGQEMMMFDEDVLTSCNMSRITGKWIVAEFEKETPLSEIRVIPSTDGNFIEKGDEYELYIWEKDGWTLILSKTADDYGHLEANYIPEGGLYLLHDATKGIEERIFTIVNEEQIWW